MQHSQKTLVVIPALNESVTVRSVVKSVIASGYPNVLVVDDCSNDDTASEASAGGAIVVKLQEHLGAWGAIQTGFRFAVRKGFRTVITLDADGQHAPTDIAQLLSKLVQDEGGANVAVACDRSRGSRLRKFAWALIRHLSGVEISDITSGFRAYDRLAIRRLASWPATLLQYQDVGILLLLKRYSLEVGEVPVKMSDRIDGISRIFDSWAAVFFYMAHTCLLSAAKRTQKHSFTGFSPSTRKKVMTE